MKKKELIDAISKRSGLAKKETETAFNAVMACFTESLTNGDTIRLPDFGSLSVKTRAARTGRNPATGKPLNIPATKTVNFKAAQKLKEAVNT